MLNQRTYAALKGCSSTPMLAFLNSSVTFKSAPENKHVIAALERCATQIEPVSAVREAEENKTAIAVGRRLRENRSFAAPRLPHFPSCTHGLHRGLDAYADSRLKKLILLLIVVCGLRSGLGAQSLSNVLTGNSSTPATATTATDSLGRNTPSGTVVGFLEAAQSGNYRVAADYLQMSSARRQSPQGPELAKKLKALMDRAFVGGLHRLSTRPEGNPEYGINDQQTIGTFSSGDMDVPVALVRVSDPDAGKIWLFSAETLSKVSDLYDNLQVQRVEKNLPEFLVQIQILGMPLWQWLALLVALPGAGAIGWGVVLMLAAPRRLWLRYRKKPEILVYQRVSLPLFVFFGGIAHRAMAGYLGLPLLSRFYYSRTIGVVIAAGLFWFVLRATSAVMQRLRAHAISVGRTGTGTLMVLGERLIKAVVVVIAVLVILGTLGFNLTTLLAGVGIGGLAIAFAAQKTLENLFGGISVLADEVIRVGDYCRFGDRAGTVEDISLRSTRVRTDNRTVLSIPNGALAAMNVENLSRRDKILFNPTLAIRCETSPDQLRYLLAELRRMLYAHPKIESQSVRLRFMAVDSSSLNVEVFGYVLTRDYEEFAAVREDILLRIVEIVGKSGTAFAYPTRTLYLAREHGLDVKKAEAAEQQVQQWREEQQLPFPDFAAADKRAVRGSIEYPEPGSASRGDSR